MSSQADFGRIYSALGVRPLINAAGTKTRFGGTRMADEVLDAMREAAQASVDMAELQAAASRVISAVTGSEAGYVTSGASAGLLLGAAACITGDDPARMDALPHTDGLPNEIVIFRSHRNSYDHAWRAAGARLVEVGLDDRTAGSGVRSLDPWELEAAIGERTVALAYVANRQDWPPLAMFVEVAHRHGLPVLVDAAAQLPPRDHLSSFVASGADLVAFSGGKAIGGPQNTGFLCGRRDLIRAVALNHLDLDVYPARWDLPPEFAAETHEAQRLPRHGIGRSCKVAKEQLVGALVALKRFAEDAHSTSLPFQQEFADALLQMVMGVDDVTAYRTAHEIPQVDLSFRSPDEAWGFVERLAVGEPAIAVDPSYASEGTVRIDTIGLQPETGSWVLARVREVLGQSRMET